MPRILMILATIGSALLAAADEPKAAAPVTEEAAPATAPTTPPAAPPGEAAQGQPAQGAEVAPKTEAPPESDTTEPLPDIKTLTEEAPKSVDSAPDANAPAAAAPSEDLVRPTEQTDQIGKRVAAFWFISTGK